MSRSVRFLAGAAALFVLVPSMATGQDASTPDRRWGLVAIWGGPGGGPASEVEAAMVRGGFDDDLACWLFCTGTIPHPTSHLGLDAVGPSRLLEVSYRLQRRVALGLTLAGTELGMTFGYRAGDDLLSSDHLFLHYGVTTIAPTAVLTVAPLRLELGPALHRATAWVDEGGRRTQVRHAYRPGLLAGAGASLRLYRALHLEARAQYRLVARATLGPFDTGSATLSPFQAEFSHTFVGVGLGLRF